MIGYKIAIVLVLGMVACGSVKASVQETLDKVFSANAAPLEPAQTLKLLVAITTLNVDAATAKNVRLLIDGAKNIGPNECNGSSFEGRYLSSQIRRLRASPNVAAFLDANMDQQIAACRDATIEAVQKLDAREVDMMERMAKATAEAPSTISRGELLVLISKMIADQIDYLYGRSYSSEEELKGYLQGDFDILVSGCRNLFNAASDHIGLLHWVASGSYGLTGLDATAKSWVRKGDMCGVLVRNTDVNFESDIWNQFTANYMVRNANGSVVVRKS